VEKALRAQHDSLQKTLEELQGYQKQQELWLQYQQKLLNEQAPPGVLLEQRLLYREHKIREIIDSSINAASGSNPNSPVGASGNGSGNSGTTSTGTGGANSGKTKSGSVTGSGVGGVNAHHHQHRDSASVVHRHVAAEACASKQQEVDGAGGGDGNEAGCNMMPILIPITFVPPS